MTEKMYDNIVEAIGNTPVVKLNRVSRFDGVNVYVKCEFMNPGGSIKDRIGWWLIEDAEKRGALKAGGTIVESTSGNTGFGLAIAAAIKGYHCVFVLPDKMSEEKIKNLRAFGARVIVTPTAVEPDDPRSYYSVSKRMAEETPNALYMDQYNNLANRDCHYHTTGPEILRQMPDIDVFIAGIGTGGTITGVGRYLKENKPGVEVVAVDPEGSIVEEVFRTGGHEQPAKTYVMEGIGEDFIPQNYDFDQYDDMVKVGDKETFLMTRELLVKEGIFAGMSSGAAVVGANRWIEAQGDRLKGKNILIVLPDSGNRYISKVYDDDWMLEMGFVESSSGTVEDLLHFLHKKPGEITMAGQHEKIGKVVEIMSEAGISQLPVADDNGWVKGIIREGALLKALFKEKSGADESINGLIDTAIEFVSPSDSVDKVSNLITQGKVPLVAEGGDSGKLLAIVTNIDVLNYLGTRKS
ncbi:MAG: pyridoxal-phosphate dependent enzyme [Gammaproteobacteria bacterium]|nr:pyridoxal-phosphate dependent enzyme [Gammaproteobacteria bacterium]